MTHIDPVSLFGKNVTDVDGKHIDEVRQVFASDETGAPTWVTVVPEGHQGKEFFVPMDHAEVVGSEIKVPYSTASVTGSPQQSHVKSLSADEEESLRAYYESVKGKTGIVKPAGLVTGDIASTESAGLNGHEGNARDAVTPATMQTEASHTHASLGQETEARQKSAPAEQQEESAPAASAASVQQSEAAATDVVSDPSGADSLDAEQDAPLAREEQSASSAPEQNASSGDSAPTPVDDASADAEGRAPQNGVAPQKEAAQGTGRSTIGSAVGTPGSRTSYAGYESAGSRSGISAAGAAAGAAAAGAGVAASGQEKGGEQHVAGVAAGDATVSASAEQAPVSKHHADPSAQTAPEASAEKPAAAEKAAEVKEKAQAVVEEKVAPKVAEAKAAAAPKVEAAQEAMAPKVEAAKEKAAPVAAKAAELKDKAAPVVDDLKAYGSGFFKRLKGFVTDEVEHFKNRK